MNVERKRRMRIRTTSPTDIRPEQNEQYSCAMPLTY